MAAEPRQALEVNGHAEAGAGAVAHANAAALLDAARRVDAAATVSAVSKTASGETLVKIAPSADAGTALALTALTAIKLKFPFVSVSANEHALTGSTELHVLIHGTREEFTWAMHNAKERRAMRVLHWLARSFFGMAALSYAVLLYETISRTA